MKGISNNNAMSENIDSYNNCFNKNYSNPTIINIYNFENKSIKQYYNIDNIEAFKIGYIAGLMNDELANLNVGFEGVVSSDSSNILSNNNEN